MGYVLRRHRFGIFSLLHWLTATCLLHSLLRSAENLPRPLCFISRRLADWRADRTFVGLTKRNSRCRDSGRGGIIAQHPAPGSFRADRKLGLAPPSVRKLRGVTGPSRARNPLLVASLYTADAFARLLSKPPERIRDIIVPYEILVANWGHLGDVVTILPLLKFLEDHPRVQDLGVLIGSWSRPVLEASDIAARIHLIDHWALDRSDRTKWRKITRYLAQRHFVI